jgi:hypothetical protein
VGGGADAEAAGGDEDFAEETDEGAEEREHGEDEEDANESRKVHFEENAAEERDDDESNHRGAGGAESDGVIHEAGALGEDAEAFAVLAVVAFIASFGGGGSFELVFDQAGAVDNPAEAAGEDIQEATDAGHEEDRGDRHLNDVSDGCDVRFDLHKGIKIRIKIKKGRAPS